MGRRFGHSGEVTDNDPSKDRSPVETLLDLVFFAPLGATIEFWEHLPEFARVGRDTLRRQRPAARMIGEFAVRQGRSRLERNLIGEREPSPANRAPAGVATGEGGKTGSAGVATKEGGKTGSAGVATGEGGKTGSAGVATGEGGKTGSAGVATEEGGETGSAGVVTEEGGETGSGSAGLPIANYDALSAVQIVPLLVELPPGERDLIAAHEKAHRGRRTVLGKLDQLARREAASGG